jgi:hypothetical protein
MEDKIIEEKEEMIVDVSPEYKFNPVDKYFTDTVGKYYIITDVYKRQYLPGEGDIIFFKKMECFWFEGAMYFSHNGEDESFELASVLMEREIKKEDIKPTEEKNDYNSLYTKAMMECKETNRKADLLFESKVYELKEKKESKLNDIRQEYEGKYYSYIFDEYKDVEEVVFHLKEIKEVFDYFDEEKNKDVTKYACYVTNASFRSIPNNNMPCDSIPFFENSTNLHLTEERLKTCQITKEEYVKKVTEALDEIKQSIENG